MNIITKIIKRATSHPLAWGSVIVFAGSMAMNVSAYLYHLIVGRILGPVAYGELASLLSLSYLLNVPAIVVQTVIAKYISKYYTKKEDGKAKQLIIQSTKILAVISCSFGLLAIPFYQNIAQYLKVTTSWYVGAMVFSSVIFFISTVLGGALQGYQKFKDVMILGNMSTMIRLIGGAIGALFGVGATVIANIVTTIFGYVITIVPFRFLLKVKTTSSSVSYKEIGAYALPSMMSILGITSLYSTDIILVKHFFSPLDAGLYAALAVMGKAIFFAGSSIGYVLFPVLAQRKESGAKTQHLIYISLLIVGAISFAITLVYVFVPRFALRMLFGAKYLDASGLLGLFGLFITFFSLANMLITALLGLGKTGVSIFSIGAALAQIVGITYLHSDLYTVIRVNIFVSAALFVALLLYYRHARATI